MPPADDPPASRSSPALSTSPPPPPAEEEAGDLDRIGSAETERPVARTPDNTLEPESEDELFINDDDDAPDLEDDDSFQVGPETLNSIKAVLNL